MPPTQVAPLHLVLVGGGHSHVEVLRRFALKSPPLRITLINPAVYAPYSGMLPGLIAGHYDFEAAHIDLLRLATHTGARLLLDTVTAIDANERVISFADRPPLHYDLLSLNTGGTPVIPTRSEYRWGIGVKPVANLLGAWQAIRTRMDASDARYRLAVVGGGAAGVELVLAIDHALSRDDANQREDKVTLTLLNAGSEILGGYPAAVRQQFQARLARQNIQVINDADVSETDVGRLTDASGREFHFDDVLWATPVKAHAWLATSGLATDSRGFVQVDSRLRSVSHPDVFAAGDVASLNTGQVPKAGVFAVREGPILAHNLRAAAEDRRLVRYRPQRNFLSILSAGEKHAVATRGRFSIAGDWVWRWKHWIDSRFMQRYRVPDAAGTTPPPLAAAVESSARQLSRAADGIFDLQALWVDDPWLAGRLLATQWANRWHTARGQTGRADISLLLPALAEEHQRDEIAQLLHGIHSAFEATHIALGGIETAQGETYAVGVRLHGIIEPEPLRDILEGDAIVLTGPVGAGATLADARRLAVNGRAYAAALTQLQASVVSGLEQLKLHGAKKVAYLDRRGLSWHLQQMCPAPLGIELDLDRLPVLAVAGWSANALMLGERLDGMGYETSRLTHTANHPHANWLHDQHASGALVAVVPAISADACITALQSLGLQHATIIGRIRRV
ncbi:MAG: FAD-dependent oxidoreductase [Gammaproteobacteria bacterium]|nr:FAD-dependent oxidoreductase [Gammaproteobacteria bacterium]